MLDFLCCTSDEMLYVQCEAFVSLQVLRLFTQTLWKHAYNVPKCKLPGVLSSKLPLSAEFLFHLELIFLDTSFLFIRKLHTTLLLAILYSGGFFQPLALEDLSLLADIKKRMMYARHKI